MPLTLALTVPFTLVNVSVHFVFTFPFTLGTGVDAWTLDLVNDEIQDLHSNRFKLVNVQVLCGARSVPSATITMFDEQ
eukprot:2536604-Rhodomonas_salina.2